ncbi:MAG: sigma factor-like helix-turn-helix DNA-binding protein [Acidimicrobiales bacterium]
MAKLEPGYWELPFDPGEMDLLPGDLLDAPADEDPALARQRQEVLAGIGELVQTHLTAKQRRLVELYFYERRTQQEIAVELGISQQVVSRQLFGVLRKGRRVGGAIQRLRTLCEERGWDPQQWV